MNVAELQEMARRVRVRIMEMAFRCGGNTHIGGALSMTDILCALYGEVLRDVAHTEVEERDRFILSKGHGALALFAVLGEVGLLDSNDLNSYLQNGSNLCAHPVMDVAKGIEASSGSLGQGVSIATGLALSLKKKSSNYRVYTLVGNGECDEGLVWEAFSAAAHYQLDNLVVIIDDNKFQNDGKSLDVMSFPGYLERMQSFGFDCVEIDGNDMNQIVDSLREPRCVGKPRAIVADTIKGKGISFMENDNSWHHNRLLKDQYESALCELKGTV